MKQEREHHYLAIEQYLNDKVSTLIGKSVSSILFFNWENLVLFEDLHKWNGSNLTKHKNNNRNSSKYEHCSPHKT